MPRGPPGKTSRLEAKDKMPAHLTNAMMTEGRPLNRSHSFRICSLSCTSPSPLHCPFLHRTNVASFFGHWFRPPLSIRKQGSRVASCGNVACPKAPRSFWCASGFRLASLRSSSQALKTTTVKLEPPNHQSYRTKFQHQEFLRGAGSWVTAESPMRKVAWHLGPGSNIMPY